MKEIDFNEFNLKKKRMPCVPVPRVMLEAEQKKIQEQAFEYGYGGKLSKEARKRLKEIQEILSDLDENFVEVTDTTHVEIEGFGEHMIAWKRVALEPKIVMLTKKDYQLIRGVLSDACCEDTETFHKIEILLSKKQK